MEDHLKNKNRLEREWEALCAYQAEPSTCDVGEQNTKRNRSDAVVVCKSIHFRWKVLFTVRKVPPYHIQAQGSTECGALFLSPVIHLWMHTSQIFKKDLGLHSC